MKSLEQEIEDLRQQVKALSERLAAVEEVIDIELILADQELSPEVAEGNAQTAADEAAELNRASSF